MRGDNNDLRNAVPQASAINAGGSNTKSVADGMVAKNGLLVVWCADDAS